jgi:hypothetical protein
MSTDGPHSEEIDTNTRGISRGHQHSEIVVSSNINPAQVNENVESTYPVPKVEESLPIQHINVKGLREDP